MKKLLLILTIVGFAIGGLLSFLEVLAATGGPQRAAWPPAAAVLEPPACDCSNLEVLQIELRNALSLQQAFRNKIAELRTMNGPTSSAELQRFAKSDARRGLEPVPGYKGPSEVDYVNRGSLLSDPAHPPKTETNESLCRMADSAQAELARAMDAAACAGIGAAVRAHEDVHQKSCLRAGFVPYFWMNGAERAQEEVEAYGAQIAALRAEIARVLEGIRIQVEVDTRAQMPPNPLYTAIIVENRAEVPMSRATVSGDTIRLDGQGQQITNATIEGNCHFTGGLPNTLPVRGSIETDGLTAQIHYAVDGTQPSISMQCTLGKGTGSGMSLPVHLSSGNVPGVNLPLRNSAEIVTDMATTEAAKIMSQGGVRMTGKGKIRLLCPAQK
jgi:hypothetical protein